MNKPDVLLWLEGSRGVYIPRDFANSFTDRAQCVSGVNDETWSILESGPEHEWYWEAWNDVCNDAIVTDEHGDKFQVYQDGDCWLIPIDMEWNDEIEFFAYPDKEC